MLYTTTPHCATPCLTSHNMTTHRKISAIEEMAVAAAEAIKQEKSLAKASKKAGKPSAAIGSMNMSMNVKESKEKIDLKGIKINDSNEVHQMKDGKGPPVPVPDPSLALPNANTSAVTPVSHGHDAVSAPTSAYTGMTSIGDTSDDFMDVENHAGHLVHAVSIAASTGSQSDGALPHDSDTMTASLLIPDFGRGPGPSDSAFSEGTVRGSGQEGHGDGLTALASHHVQYTAITALANAKNVPKHTIENVPEKRSSRVRVPKRIFEADSTVQSSEEMISTNNCEDDATVPKGGADGVTSEGSLPVEPEEPEEEEEPVGMTVVLPDELTPNPDPTSYLPCLVYSLPCEDAFYACCMDQVGAVMSCHVVSCHVMSCHVMSCHVEPNFPIMPYYEMLRYDILSYLLSQRRTVTHTLTHSHSFYHSLPVLIRQCLMCGSAGGAEYMLFCVDCGEAFHSYCADLPLSTMTPAFRLTWRCTNCKLCEICGIATEDQGNCLVYCG